MHFLFVKHSLAFPRGSGHDVHGYEMMRALAALGHEVSLATVVEPSAEALEGLTLASRARIDGPHPGHPPEGEGLVADASFKLTYWQERFRSYWGIPEKHIAAVCGVAIETQADVVVAVGLEVLPYLAGIPQVQNPKSKIRTVWYAADEWIWHHLSQLQVARPGTWRELRSAAIKGLYERAYSSACDRVWVVSQADCRAMRYLAGMKRVDVLPNGVDSGRYAPLVAEEAPHSCVFWGRLDFGPNVQALEWFCRSVWPDVRRLAPTATFSIYGFQPTPRVERLARVPGVSVVADLPDLRPRIASNQVVVLPFVSGGGIKNKLLEAAAMGKAIVASPAACRGLRGQGELPFKLPARRSEWADQLVALWRDEEMRRRLGCAARHWVVEQHTWEAAARDAVAGLERMNDAMPRRATEISAGGERGLRSPDFVGPGGVFVDVKSPHPSPPPEGEGNTVNPSNHREADASRSPDTCVTR